MRTIGIRSTPKDVTFAIFDSDEKRVVNIERIRVPAALTFPEALKFIRSNLLDVLREYDIRKAGIRVCEPTAQSPDQQRVQIEGVIQEAFASSSLTSYYIGHVSSIAARLGIPRSHFKPLVSGEAEYAVENWSLMTDIKREAILCAIGAINA